MIHLKRLKQAAFFVSAALYYHCILSKLEEFNAKTTHNRTLEYSFVDVLFILYGRQNE